MLESHMGLQECTVRFSGPFDKEKVLKGIRAWITDRGYDFTENVFKMKKGGEGWSLEVGWKGVVKANEFVTKTIEVDFNIQSIRDIEIVVGGKKRKVQHGDGHIRVTGSLDFGKDGAWKDWPRLLDFYLNYIYKQEYLIKWADSHWYDIEGLAQLARNLLEFEVS